MATYISDGSPSDIQAKVNGASAGDTISVPAGSYTWNSGVTISRGITLQGAGSGSTTIKRQSGWNGTMAHITGLASDVNVRVTGFTFENVNINNNVTTYNVLVEHTHTSSFAYTQIRIDHCVFNHGQRPVCWVGRAWGVVDHCTFNDCSNCGYFIGWEDDLGNAAWNRQDWQAGGPNFPFFEDCNFNCTNAFGTPYSPWMFYHENGARSVVRYSTIDSHTNTNSIEGPIDCHGSQGYWTGNYNDQRSTIRTEFYNNNVHLNNSFRVMDLRGGSHLIHDNTYTFDNSSPHICDFREEEVDETSVPFGGGARTENHYPCEDQIHATFVWGNKINGVNQTDADIGVGTFGDPGGNDAIVIQKGRDFWTKAPDSTTQTSYAQPASPSSPSYPTNYLEVTSYTPYTYPHPLVSGEAVPEPSPPDVADGTTVPVSIGQTKVNVTHGGDYTLEGSVQAPGDDANSLWIDFDSDPLGDDNRSWDIAVSAEWNTQEVSWRSQRDTAKIWSLSAGEHTLYIVQREPAQIQSVTFRVTTGAPPAGGGLYSQWLDSLAAWIEANPAGSPYNEWLDRLAGWVEAHPASANPARQKEAG